MAVVADPCYVLVVKNQILKKLKLLQITTKVNDDLKN